MCICGTDPAPKDSLCVCVIERETVGTKDLTKVLDA